MLVRNLEAPQLCNGTRLIRRTKKPQSKPPSSRDIFINLRYYRKHFQGYAKVQVYGSQYLLEFRSYPLLLTVFTFKYVQFPLKNTVVILSTRLKFKLKLPACTPAEIRVFCTCRVLECHPAKMSKYTIQKSSKFRSHISFFFF